MRVSVVGTSGSGKSTMAARIASAFDIPLIELDAINWQAGWRDLNTHDPEEFKRRVAQAVAADAWVIAGNYSLVRPIYVPRLTHIVWLDYPKRVVMRRVIGRSIARAIDRKELWPGTGNREDLRMWLDKDHPIRWAWDTFDKRRREYEQRFANPEKKDATLIRLRHPRDAEGIVARLVAKSASPS
jgi:adenylate kinase family enzyme